MQFRDVLVVGVAIWAIGGIALANGEPTVEERLRSLERRVIELERRLEAAPPAPAAAPASAAPARAAAAEAAAAEAAAAAAATPMNARTVAEAPVTADWQALRKGMTWSQVSAVLGKPGKKRIGVMSEIWFYPDADGGSVEFDRNGRVSGWNPPPR